MIIKIEAIIGLISALFVLFSLIRFLRFFRIHKKIALHRIKLARYVVNYFILLLSANFILVVSYSLAAGPSNVKYGIAGAIAYTIIFGLFFLYLSYAIEGRKPII